ncbi:MAG: hypothetical protein C4576_06180 [Desulfobacteraceae bacterium]|nr:MAG: hypothetical protein C4576_06180 [Desulfobacteraceae bacterium]
MRTRCVVTARLAIIGILKRTAKNIRVKTRVVIGRHLPGYTPNSITEHHGIESEKLPYFVAKILKLIAVPPGSFGTPFVFKKSE